MPHRILLVSSLSLFAFIYVYLLIEEGRELEIWENSPSTRQLYRTPQVCIQDEHTNEITTLDSDEEMTNASHILNCGHCGKCSNPADIQIYHETRGTLTTIATQCTVRGLYRFLDIHYVKACLIEDSHMSSPCVDCWILNVECNWKHCLKTCVKHKTPPFRWLPSWYKRAHESPLDPCIECDERMCGPLFIDCAGANRRRVGVVSDLQRDANLEICNKADWNWVESKAKETEQQEPVTHTKKEATSTEHEL
jgi:hypothetical protein